MASFIGGFRSGICRFFMGDYTKDRDVNLESLLYWSYALYQQALDMGVRGTHTRLLGEKSPNTPFEKN
jgi:hypothetical protein